VATHSPLITRLSVLERTLADRSSVLADEIARPASERNASAVEAHWSAIAELHPECEAMASDLKTLKRPRPGARTSGGMAARTEACKQHAAYFKAKTFISQLQAWPDVERVVARHVRPTSSPLLPTLPENDLATFVYSAMHRLANPADQDNQSADVAYPDIPMPILPFDALMLAAYRVTLALGPGRPRRFLDVGCGGGTKVYLASRYFEACDGLDLDPGYADAARRTLQRLDAFGCSAFQENALQFDGYGDYDVIYFFRPMRDDDMLDALEDRLLAQARPGTVIVAPYDSVPRPRRWSRLSEVAGPICVAGMTDDEAARLRQNAEATGTTILTRSRHMSHPGFWAPIFDAASFGPL